MKSSAPSSLGITIRADLTPFGCNSLWLPLDAHELILLHCNPASSIDGCEVELKGEIICPRSPRLVCSELSPSVFLTRLHVWSTSLPGPVRSRWQPGRQLFLDKPRLSFFLPECPWLVSLKSPLASPDSCFPFLKPCYKFPSEVFFLQKVFSTFIRHSPSFKLSQLCEHVQEDWYYD